MLIRKKSLDLVIITNRPHQIMKKVLLLSILFFAFSLNANAQAEKKELSVEKKELSIQEKAKINFIDLKSVITTEDPNIDQALIQLFEKKHKMLSKENITVAEKQEISNRIDAKLRATLNYESIKKLEEKQVYNKLIN